MEVFEGCVIILPHLPRWPLYPIALPREGIGRQADTERSLWPQSVPIHLEALDPQVEQTSILALLDGLAQVRTYCRPCRHLAVASDPATSQPVCGGICAGEKRP